jgi:hypothetical protein
MWMASWLAIKSNNQVAGVSSSEKIMIGNAVERGGAGALGKCPQGALYKYNAFSIKNV